MSSNDPPTPDEPAPGVWSGNFRACVQITSFGTDIGIVRTEIAGRIELELVDPQLAGHVPKCKMTTSLDGVFARALRSLSVFGAIGLSRDGNNVGLRATAPEPNPCTADSWGLGCAPFPGGVFNFQECLLRSVVPRHEHPTAGPISQRGISQHPRGARIQA